MHTHHHYNGDSLTPLGLQLKQKNSSGTLSPYDLTGKTVKIKILDHSGAVALAETTTGVTVTAATTGKIQYDFPSGSSALAEGTYYLYVKVYSGSERDTYPVEEKQMRIIVHKHESS